MAYPYRAAGDAQATLDDFADVCDELGIRFWLAFGTLLGFWRDGGFVVGDTDIDVGVMCNDEDYERLLDAMEQNGFVSLTLPPESRRRDGSLDICHTWKRNILLDLWRLDRDKHHVYGTCEEAKPFFRREEFMAYAGRRWRVPSPVEDYLAFCYGRGWRTPTRGCKDGSDVNKNFWGTRVERYDEQQWATHDSYLRAFIKAGKFRPQDTVLDIGSGTGIVTAAVAPLVQEVIGLDSSPVMVKRASMKHPAIRFEVGDARAMQYPDGRFDKVTARMVFHHIIADGERAARECHRVLKPGGAMVISEGTPPAHRLADWYTEMFALKERRRTMFTEDIVELLVSGGFKVESVHAHVSPQMSIKNWLDNSGLPDGKKTQIWQMHLDLNDDGKQLYKMIVTDSDILCDFKFATVVGRKT